MPEDTKQDQRYSVIIYGFYTKEEAEEARKKCQFDFCKWAAIEEE